MASTWLPNQFALLQADGGADGILTITSNQSWLPGARVRIISTAEDSLELVVIEQIGSQQVRCRAASSPASFGGGTDLSAYATGDAASLNMESQVVRVEAPFTPRLKA